MTQIAINPNTAHRAYRDLEAEGLVEDSRDAGPSSWRCQFQRPRPSARPNDREVIAWIDKARCAGMDDEGIFALVAHSMRTRDSQMEEVAL